MLPPGGTGGGPVGPTAVTGPMSKYKLVFIGAQRHRCTYCAMGSAWRAPFGLTLGALATASARA